MENVTKNYELRDLCSKDVFPMFKIISKIGIKEFKSSFEADEVKTAIAKANKKNSDVDLSALGLEIFLDIANVIISNLPSCEDDIYTLLSGLSRLSKKEISELPLIAFTEMIIDVIKKEEFKDFIKVVSKLLK